MGFFKRAMALLLVLTMSLCLVFSADAATSPTSAPVNPGFNTATSQDSNTQDNANVTVVSTVGGANAAVDSVLSTGGADSVNLVVARDASNNAVAITKVGNGKNGAFDQTIKTVSVSSPATEVVIATKALNKSRVKVLNVNTNSVRIQKNAFKGTYTKNAIIYINGAKKAADVKIVKRSFNGLNKKARIIVNKKMMNKKQFNKLKRKLRRSGFKGKIVRR